MRSRRTAAGALFALALALALAFFMGVGSGAVHAAGYARGPAPDFTLVDQHGRPFTLSRQRGRPVVLFFGYTHCPDVCPTILANLKRARASVPNARDTVVALVTVDPKRDTAAEIGRFVGEFDPSFVGLTGSDAALARVYRAYHVKIVMTELGAGYSVSHTAFVYYIARDGRLSGFGTWNDPQPVLDEDLGAITHPAHHGT